MSIGEYLKQATRLRHRWGETDCCLWPADWVLQRRGFDPAAQWRGRYSTEEQALEFVTEAGGMVKMWSSVLPMLDRVDEPRDGDVGVVLVSGVRGPVANGSIYAAGRWSFLADRGLIRCTVQPEFVKAIWRV